MIGTRKMENMDKSSSEKGHDIQKCQSKRLMHTAFLQREHDIYHHTYEEELLQYEYIRNGDMKSVGESKRMFRTGIAGKLSDDPIRDKKYLFVASITLVTRFCIEGGMQEEEAYNLSDLYIQQMDHCSSVPEIYELHTIMITDFTERMAYLRQKGNSSKAIKRSMDYIYYHLHEKLTLADVAKAVSLTPNYLAALFRKEKGMTVQNYIRMRRIEAARNMLLYSDYTLTEIGEFLAFSSPSHFIKTFKDTMGCTPREYQQKNFRRHWQEYGNGIYDRLPGDTAGNEIDTPEPQGEASPERNRIIE